MKRVFKLLTVCLLAAVMLAACVGCSPEQEVSVPLITVPVGSEPDTSKAEILNVSTMYTNTELKGYHDTNSDFIGILEIPALGLREVVVTCPPGSTDNQYYLRRGLNRNQRHLGIIYFDYNCLTNGVWEENNVLYGHNVGKSKYSDEMFGKLANYINDNTLYETADLITFTAYNGYTYYFRLVAAYPTSPYPNGDKYFCRTTDFEEDTSYHYTDMRRYKHYIEFLQTIEARSDFQTDEDLHFYDKILTLITCIYEPEDYRYVLHAKLLDTTEVSEYFEENPEYLDTTQIIGNPLPY